MKTITLGEKTLHLLTQQEKAEELGIEIRKFRRKLIAGDIPVNKTMRIPGSSRLWYLKEGETYEQ